MLCQHSSSMIEINQTEASLPISFTKPDVFSMGMFIIDLTTTNQRSSNVLFPAFQRRASTLLDCLLQVLKHFLYLKILNIIETQPV